MSKKQMDAYRACGLVEGFEAPDAEEEVIEAWQYLVDTGLAWSLPGRIGRFAADMIAEGLITDGSDQNERDARLH